MAQTGWIESFFLLFFFYFISYDNKIDWLFSRKKKFMIDVNKNKMFIIRIQAEMMSKTEHDFLGGY